LVAIKEKEGGKPSSVAPQAPAPQLRAYLREVLPNFDEDKVYNTDIKKLLSWYNILIEHNIDFETVESPEEDTGDSAAETGGE
jgi:hypothetical protein